MTKDDKVGAAAQLIEYEDRMVEIQVQAEGEDMYGARRAGRRRGGTLLSAAKAAAYEGLRGRRPAGGRGAARKWPRRENRHGAQNWPQTANEFHGTARNGVRACVQAKKIQQMI